jgi:hypothetical protein
VADEFPKIINRFSLSLFLLFSIFLCTYAQGGLEHIKKQSYLQLYNGFDCDNIPDELYSTLSEKICANLALQRSDSILVLYYDSLKVELEAFGGPALVLQFDSLQTSWRSFRDTHCTIIWNKYEGCGGCNLRATHYMTVMRELTDLRIATIKEWLALYRRED